MLTKSSSEATYRVQGSCLCAQIAYEVELLPEKTFNCHCSFCRKAHGAAFATLTLAKGDTLTIKRGNARLKEHENNLGGFRAFCSNCGTRLMNYAPDKSMYLARYLGPLHFLQSTHR